MGQSTAAPARPESPAPAPPEPVLVIPPDPVLPIVDDEPYDELEDEEIAPAAPPAPSGPVMVCGYCRAVAPDPGPSHSVRCPTCSHHIRRPRSVVAYCERCGHERGLALHELQSHRPCPECGGELKTPEVVLTPRRRRRRRRPYHRNSTYASGPADAAWAVLIVGLTLLILLASLVLA